MPRPKKFSLQTARILTRRQVDLLRAAIKRCYPTAFEYYRAHLLLALILYMGLDLDEIVGMKVSDIKPDGIWLHFKERSIPYSPQIRSLTRLYLAYRSTKCDPEEEALFVWYRHAMGRKGLGKIIREVSTEAHVRADVRILRDTFAYNLAVDGAPGGLICTLRGCTPEEANHFILLAMGDEDVTKVYLRSIEQRMRPVSKRVRRATDGEGL